MHAIAHLLVCFVGIRCGWLMQSPADQRVLAFAKRWPPGSQAVEIALSLLPDGRQDGRGIFNPLKALTVQLLAFNPSLKPCAKLKCNTVSHEMTLTAEKGNELSSMTVKELKSKLRTLGLKVSGNKKELIVRVLEAEQGDASSKAELMLNRPSRLPEAEGKADVLENTTEQIYELRDQVKRSNSKEPASKAEQPTKETAKVEKRPEPQKLRQTLQNEEGVQEVHEPSVMPQNCPSCGHKLTVKNYRKHMAFCSPDLLDPEGWVAGDQAVVLRQIKMTRSKSDAKVLYLRFGDEPVTSQQELASMMGWTQRQVRDKIASLLRSIPPVADVDAPLNILYEDPTMIVVAKPAGVPITPEHRWRGGAMLNRVMGHLKLRPGASVPAPCHRLDLDTSGVLVFAKTKNAATALMSQFEKLEVTKTYAALTSNFPEAEVVDRPICRISGIEHCQRCVCQPGEEAEGQSARTAIQVVTSAMSTGSTEEQSASRPCLVLLRPEQGRTHQVRVHCQAAGAPILADELYGGDVGPAAADGHEALLQRHALHALLLTCKHPRSGRLLEFLAPMPEDMTEAAHALGIRWDDEVLQGTIASVQKA